MPPRSPVPEALRAVAAQQESLVCTRQCLDAGVSPNVLTRLVRSGSWSRITAGVYDLDPTPLHARPPDRRRRRAAWAALLAFGPEAVAVGPCALALLGVAGLPSRVVPQATLPGARGLESRDGIRLRMFDDGMTVVRVGDRYVAAPEWALAQAVPELDRPHALRGGGEVVERGEIRVADAQPHREGVHGVRVGLQHFPERPGQLLSLIHI